MKRVDGAIAKRMKEEKGEERQRRRALSKNGRISERMFDFLEMNDMLSANQNVQPWPTNGFTCIIWLPGWMR